MTGRGKAKKSNDFKDLDPLLTTGHRPSYRSSESARSPARTSPLDRDKPASTIAGRLREELGFRTRKAFAEAVGIAYSHYVTLETGSADPRSEDHLGWTPAAQAIAAFHGLPCEEVWPDHPLTTDSPPPRVDDPSIEDRLGALQACRSLHTATKHALETLNPKERAVLDLRFGLTHGDDKSLEAVGGSLNLTRERIRQIEAKALRKLRHPSRAILPQEREEE